MTPEDLSSYIPNFLHGLLFNRAKFDKALHVPEGDTGAEGNIRIKETLEIKVDGEWQKVHGDGGPVDAAPVAGSPRPVASGGVFSSLANFVNKLRTITINGTTKSLENNISFDIKVGDIPNLLPMLEAERFTRIASDNNIIDGAPVEGDSLNKLYNLVIGGFKEIPVNDIAERDALDIQVLPTQVFVQDDGDGRWALYRAITTGSPATFVKLSDPDLLNAALTASQIKAAYESNPDTNAFTNGLKTKLEALYQPDISGIAINALAISNEISARISADNAIIEMITSLQIKVNQQADEFTPEERVKLRQIIGSFS
jgi:hypothetical protein